MSNKLNIADYNYPVTTLGPGKRFALWVQGCPFTCEGCCSTDYIPFVSKTLKTSEELADLILSLPELEGVTFSGGEPFAQASAIAKLVRKLKLKRPDFTFICFTGYSLRNLKSKGQKELLKELDLVITELFEKEKNSGLGLRGSDNQEFIFLTDKLVPFKDEIIKGPKRTETFIKDNVIVQVGVMCESEQKYHHELLKLLNDL